jgi:hypothetical protein
MPKSIDRLGNRLGDDTDDQRKHEHPADRDDQPNLSKSTNAYVIAHTTCRVIKGKAAELDDA